MTGHFKSELVWNTEDMFSYTEIQYCLSYLNFDAT